MDLNKVALCRKKKRRKDDDEDFDFDEEIKKSKKTKVKAHSRVNLKHLKDLLKRSNFYANSLLNIITEEQKRREAKQERKLKKLRKRLKKITDKIKKDYGKKCRKAPSIYIAFLESEENQVSFGEKICCRVACTVSHLVKRVNNDVKVDNSQRSDDVVDVMNFILDKTCFECNDTATGCKTKTYTATTPCNNGRLRENDCVKVDNAHITDDVVDVMNFILDKTCFECNATAIQRKTNTCTTATPRKNARLREDDCELIKDVSFIMDFILNEISDTTTDTAAPDNTTDNVRGHIKVATRMPRKNNFMDSIQNALGENNHHQNPEFFGEDLEGMDSRKVNAIPSPILDDIRTVLNVLITKACSSIPDSTSISDSRKISSPKLFKTLQGSESDATPFSVKLSATSYQKINKCRRKIDMNPALPKYSDDYAAIIDGILNTVCSQIQRDNSTALAASLAKKSVCGERNTSSFGNVVVDSDFLKIDVQQLETKGIPNCIEQAKDKKDCLYDRQHIESRDEKPLARCEIKEKVSHCSEVDETKLMKSIKVKEERILTVDNPTINAADSQTSEISLSGNKVPCPICCKMVGENRINQHLDICVSRGERRESLRSKPTRSTKMPRKVKKKCEDRIKSLVLPVGEEVDTSISESNTDELVPDLDLREHLKESSITTDKHLSHNEIIPSSMVLETKDLILHGIEKSEGIVESMKDELKSDCVCESTASFKLEKTEMKMLSVSPTLVNTDTKTDRVPDLDDVIGYCEEEEASANSSSDCESMIVDTPVVLRRSARVSRFKRSYKEDSDDDIEEDEAENTGDEETFRKQKEAQSPKKQKIMSIEKTKDENMKVYTKEKYCVGDVVQVIWGKGDGGKLYKAKILDRCPTNDDDWTYLVHYLGWSDSFDDWIFSSDIHTVLQSYDEDLGRGCKFNQLESLATDDQSLLNEKFYMPGISNSTILTSLVTTQNGERYFKNLKVNSAQPKLFTGGALRDYQVTGYEWMKILFDNGENGILADEMGLGKTIQCIAIVCKLVESGVGGPFLICAPMSTIQNWFLEFRRFAPKIPLLLYHGNAGERETLSLCMIQQEKKLKTRPVVITTYDILMRDRMIFQVHGWSYMILDEGHRIKNLKCKLLQELHHIQSHAKLLLTGTPLQNNLSELWSLLNFLLPEVFDDLETFETWFNMDRLKKNQNLLSMIHKVLTPFLLRRMKSDVDLKLPPKKEIVLYVPLTSKQERFYRGLVDQTIRELLNQKKYYNITIGVANPDTVVQKQSSQDLSVADSASENEKSSMQIRAPPEKFVQNFSMSNTIMQLRKCCNHPYLIEYPCDSNTGDIRIDDSLVRNSGKLLVLDQLLPKLKERGHKVLIFSQMTKMLDILEDYCFMKGFRCVRIDGQMKRDDRVDSISSFTSDPDVFIFLLSTRAGGLGINLTAADTVILYDSDWNPQNDAQAQDRCHRIGQEKPVVVYRLITSNTVDQQIVERASKKIALGKMVMNAGLFKGNLERDLTDKSKINPEELLHLLETKTETCTIDEKCKEVFSEQEMERLLDRSEMMK